MKLIFVFLLCLKSVVAQECEDLIGCLLDIELTLNSETPSELCNTNDFVITNELETCVDPDVLDTCDSETKPTVRNKKEELFQLYTRTCANYAGNTTPGTTVPVYEGCEDRMQELVMATENCISRFDELPELRQNLQLTGHAICGGIQAKIDCLLDTPVVMECPTIAEEAYRHIVSDIKFAHLFGCDVAIQGTTVSSAPREGCRFWEWLSCHDSLLQALSLGHVDEGFNLDFLIELINVDSESDSSVIGDVVMNQASCRNFSTVDWGAMIECRAELQTMCGLLYVPPSDSLWTGVQGLLAQLTVNIVDPLTDLMDLQEICSPVCANFLIKQQAVIQCLVQGSSAITAIINKQNLRQSYESECQELESTLSCISSQTGSCDYLTRRTGQLMNFFSTNAPWQAAIALCGSPTTITAEPGEGCEGLGRRVIEDAIISECSSQYSSWRQDILDEEMSVMDLCTHLETVSTCYWRYIRTCPNFERSYWSGEVSLMMAANQMLSCDISIGNLKVSSTTEECEWARWMECVRRVFPGPALDSTDETAKAFRRLLKLVWEDWNETEKKEKCNSLRELDFLAINTCILDLSLDCDFPSVTVPSGQDYQLELRDPFNLLDIKAAVDVLCTEDCGQDLGSSLQTCVRENTLALVPLDIVYGDYIGSYDRAKCRKLVSDVNCVHQAVSEECEEFTGARDLARSPAIAQAQVICKRCCSNKSETPTITGKGTTNTPRLIKMLLITTLSLYVTGLSSACM